MEIKYKPLPTILKFHESMAQYRCLVGPVGSGKSVGGIMEAIYYLPMYLKSFGIKKYRVAVVRNSYRELKDTTMKTVVDWFPFGTLNITNMVMKLEIDGVQIEILFRACDKASDVKKFKSLELTTVLVDEASEVSEEIILMLKNRIGRFPNRNYVKTALKRTKHNLNTFDYFGWGIYSTNPPETSHFIYCDFEHMNNVPGPIPERKHLYNHELFWQPQNENDENLPKDYYQNLMNAYANNPDWCSMYIQGKPGILVEGRPVYSNFSKKLHVSKEPLIWDGGRLFCGVDNSGNTPAAVILQCPTAGVVHVLKEYYSEKEGIIDFTKRMIMDMNIFYPNADALFFGDPAGENMFSKASGGFTSNAELMRECGIDLVPSDQNWIARREAVECQLGKLVSGESAMLIDNKCIMIINGMMGGYAYKERQSGVFADYPIKNKFSHVQDALQYVLVRLVQRVESSKKKAIRNVNKKTNLSGNWAARGKAGIVTKEREQTEWWS